MTPGINVATKSKIPFQLHEYAHDESSESYGLEVCKCWSPWSWDRT